MGSLHLFVHPKWCRLFFFLEKHVLDPLLTHFCSQNGQFSRHFGTFHGPNLLTTGSKWARNPRDKTKQGKKEGIWVVHGEGGREKKG